MFSLIPITKADKGFRESWGHHYSHPKGFVGRQIFYRIQWGDTIYGYIGFGSATRHLAGRPKWYVDRIGLNHGLNNTFYHVEKVNGKYPRRNFTVYTLLRAEITAREDYERKYLDQVRWFETLVELPREGRLYKMAGYEEVGQTKGFTCKRVSGKSSDGWSGKRVWDTINFRPKRVFIKFIETDCYPCQNRSRVDLDCAGVGESQMPDGSL